MRRIGSSSGKYMDLQEMIKVFILNYFLIYIKKGIEKSDFWLKQEAFGEKSDINQNIDQVSSTNRSI
jgi:hypothetical protein